LGSGLFCFQVCNASLRFTQIVTMLSKAASMVAGVLIAHFYSDGFFPASHAAWSWECTYYTGGDIKAPVYMAVNATDGPTCADDSKLTCSCPSTPCKGPAAALPSNLVCAGAGDDAATSGCFKLHHTYGTPAHAAVAGRGAADQVSDACGAADIVKVYGNAAGLDTMVSWGALTADIIDNSTQPLSAQACQTLCAGNADCKFFTFNDQGASGGNYMYFRGLCVLHKALACNGTQYSTFHGAIAGPSACPDGVTVPPAATPPAPEPAPSPAPSPAPEPAAPEPAPSPAPEPAPEPAGTATDASTAYNSQRLAVLTFGAILSAFLFA